MSSSANADVKATFSANTNQSQSSMLMFVIADTIIFVLATLLFCAGHEKPGYLFAVIGAALGFYLAWAWNRSQQDADSGNAQATTITAPDGTSVSTDVRVMRSPEAVESLLQLTAVALYRKPLPEPSGLVDDFGAVMSNSEAQAQVVVARINAAVQAITAETIDSLGISQPNAEHLLSISGATPDESQLRPDTPGERPVD